MQTHTQCHHQIIAQNGICQINQYHPTEIKLLLFEISLDKTRFSLREFICDHVMLQSIRSNEHAWHTAPTKTSNETNNWFK